VQALYPDGIVFNQLENLKLCPCDSNWSKLFVRLLKYSPNLRELEVSLNEVSFFDIDLFFWFDILNNIKPSFYV